jgi:hypothetical protein
MSARDPELDEAIRRFGAAWAAGDGAALDTLLSPTYTHSDVFGRFPDRAAWLGLCAGSGWPRDSDHLPRGPAAHRR